MIIYLTILIAIAGALIYALSSGKASELGRLMFGCGLLAYLLGIAVGKIVHF